MMHHYKNPKLNWQRFDTPIYNNNIEEGSLQIGIINYYLFYIYRDLLYKEAIQSYKTVDFRELSTRRSIR